MSEIEVRVERRYPANRPNWLGTWQPWPCGRCGKEVDNAEAHDCPSVCVIHGVDHEAEK